MFSNILIKSGSKATNNLLSIADVVDMMFYYNEVHIVISQFELKQLLDSFGEDVLYELIKSKRLYVHPCDQHIGVPIYQGGLSSVGLYRQNYNSIEEILYFFHKRTIDDSNKNRTFAKRFSDVLSQYLYPKEIMDSLYNDIENEDLLSRTTQVFIKQNFPSYQDIEKIHVKAEPTHDLLNRYKITGNLRIEELNTMLKQKGYSGGFDYTTILMALGETNMDCYFASTLEADVIGKQRWSEVYRLRMSECINKVDQTRNNIDHFHNTVAYDYLSPGESFIQGLISPKDLLQDLNCNDSDRFRKWLSESQQDQLISNKLYNEIQNLNSNKTWVKATRSLAQFALGFIPVIGPIISGGLTFLDGLVGDKIINGWQPTLFVENVLNKEQYKK